MSSSNDDDLRNGPEDLPNDDFFSQNENDQDFLGQTGNESGDDPFASLLNEDSSSEENESTMARLAHLADDSRVGKSDKEEDTAHRLSELELLSGETPNESDKGENTEQRLANLLSDPDFLDHVDHGNEEDTESRLGALEEEIEAMENESEDEEESTDEEENDVPFPESGTSDELGDVPFPESGTSDESGNVPFSENGTSDEWGGGFGSDFGDGGFGGGFGTDFDKTDQEPFGATGFSSEEAEEVMEEEPEGAADSKGKKGKKEKKSKKTKEKKAKVQKGPKKTTGKKRSTREKGKKDEYDRLITLTMFFFLLVIVAGNVIGILTKGINLPFFLVLFNLLGLILLMIPSLLKAKKKRDKVISFFDMLLALTLAFLIFGSMALVLAQSKYGTSIKVTRSSVPVGMEIGERV